MPATLYWPSYLPGKPTADPFLNWKLLFNGDSPLDSGVTPFRFPPTDQHDIHGTVIATVPQFLYDIYSPTHLSSDLVKGTYTWQCQPHLYRGDPPARPLGPLGDIFKRGVPKGVGIDNFNPLQPLFYRDPFNFGLGAVTIGGITGICLRVLGQCVTSSPLVSGTTLETLPPGDLTVKITYHPPTGAPVDVWSLSGSVVLDYVVSAPYFGPSDYYSNVYIGHIMAHLPDQMELYDFPLSRLPFPTPSIPGGFYPGWDTHAVHAGIVPYRGTLPYVSVATPEWSPDVWYWNQQDDWFGGFRNGDVVTYGGTTWRADQGTIRGVAPSDPYWKACDPALPDYRPDNILEVTSSEAIAWELATDGALNYYNLIQVFPPELVLHSVETFP